MSTATRNPETLAAKVRRLEAENRQLRLEAAEHNRRADEAEYQVRRLRQEVKCLEADLRLATMKTAPRPLNNMTAKEWVSEQYGQEDRRNW